MNTVLFLVEEDATASVTHQSGNRKRPWRVKTLEREDVDGGLLQIRHDAAGDRKLPWVVVGLSHKFEGKRSILNTQRCATLAEALRR